MALGMRVTRVGLGASTRAPFNWQAAQLAMTSQQTCQTLDSMIEVVIARTIETAAFDLIRGAAKKAILEASAETILTLVKANGGSIQNLINMPGLGLSNGRPGGDSEQGDTPDPNMISQGN